MNFYPRYVSRFVLSTAGIAAAATALAEFIGAAIALKMLFGIPLLIGSVLTAVICTVMLITNSYRNWSGLLQVLYPLLHWPTSLRSIWSMWTGRQQALLGRS